jgi:hypothetical protein
MPLPELDQKFLPALKPWRQQIHPFCSKTRQVHQNSGLLSDTANKDYTARYADLAVYEEVWRGFKTPPISE